MSAASASTALPTPAAVAEESKKDIKAIGKHTVSRELQLYYTNIVDAILSGDDTVSARAVNSVREDPGLTKLVTYFSQFVAEQVRLRHLMFLFASFSALLLDLVAQAIDSW